MDAINGTGTYLLNTFFMVAILLTLWIRSSGAIHERLSLNRCRGLITTTALYVIMDAAFIISSLSTSWPKEIFHVAVFLFYVVYTLLPFVWHIFVRNFVGMTFRPLTRKLEIIPLGVLLGLIVCNLFWGVLWSFDESGTYVRGPLFSFYTYLNFFYYCEPFLYAVVILLRRQQKEEPYLLQSVLISMVPLVATAVNNLVIPVYEIFPFQPFCSTLVALLAYFFMAARESESIQSRHQKELNSALQLAQEASQQATEANEVKSRFLSNMSHDIRTPMNAIINLTQLALKEEDPKVVREYLSRMEVSENFLLGLINDILDMSRIESGEFELHKENLTRTEFLNTVDTVVRPLMEQKHIHFHPELRPGQFTIYVDKLRFNQIFFNLLSNAAKFTPEGGDVWFEVNNLEVKGDKLRILFRVRDNGIGMSEEFLDRLYEPFAREHSQLNSSTPGTGLGLSIVRGLVKAMGGTITVKSKLGEGTEFDVVFDVDIVSREEINPPEVLHEKAPELKGMEVLLVEDNEINTYVARILLENAGCVVTEAQNGKEAVEAFQSSSLYHFDAILMDLRMPVMDGFEATRLIRAMDRADAENIPIIAMTADAFTEEKQRTLEAGMNAHLSKPVDANQVYAVLSDCVIHRGRDNPAK